MKSFLNFLKDESGQTSTEYILLVAVVALIVFRFRGIAEERLASLTENVFGGADNLANQLMQ